MNLSFSNITLRPWRKSDAEGLAVMANDKEIADNLRDGFPYPYTLQDAGRWLGIVVDLHDPPRFFAIEVDGELAGSIGISLKDDIYRLNAEIGYYIARKHAGKGIMTQVIRETVNYAFGQFDIIRIYAEPYADNLASRRVLEKAGFTCEAVLKSYVVKNGVIKDSCIYSRLRSER